MVEIAAAIPVEWTDAISHADIAPVDQSTGWWGLFLGDALQPKQRPSYVRHAELIFTVFDSLRLLFDHASVSFQEMDWIRVRVVRDSGRMPRIDPTISIDQVHSWRLWI